jgi:hypothetical protein
MTGIMVWPNVSLFPTFVVIIARLNYPTDRSRMAILNTLITTYTSILHDVVITVRTLEKLCMIQMLAVKFCLQDNNDSRRPVRQETHTRQRRKKGKSFNSKP